MEKHDKELVVRASKLVDQLSYKMPFDILEDKFPICYTQPMHSSIHKEANLFKILLSTIQDALLDLMATFEGQCADPYETERLWNQIQRNVVPDKWL